MARVQLTINDPAHRLTLRAMLEAAGHRVVESDPDVVVTDDIPRAVELAKKWPTLAMAGTAQVREAVTAMRQGVYGYVHVPLQPGEADVLVCRAASERPRPEKPELVPLEEVEARHIDAVLRYCKGNKAEAARILGIGRNTLWRKLKKRARARTGM